MTSAVSPRSSFRGGPMIAQDRPCRSCGYNLKGLFVGGNCPECGRTIGGGRRELQSNLIDAPRSWLIVLALGLTLMCSAWIVFAGLLLVSNKWIPRTHEAQLAVGCIVGGLWSLGTLIVLRDRPKNLRPANQTSAEMSRTAALRVTTFLTQIAIVPALVFDYLRLSGGHPLLGYLAMLFGAAAVVGQIPLCYWLARVCEWSDDESLANRFRSLGWGVAIIAVLCLLVTGFRYTRIPPLVMFATYWGWLFFAAAGFAVLAVLFSITQMAIDVRWIFRNADSLELRDETRAARAAEDARRHWEAAEASKPAPIAPEVQAMMNRVLTPEGAPGGNVAPSSLPQAGFRPLNERVIPKAKDGAYGLEGDQSSPSN